MRGLIGLLYITLTFMGPILVIATSDLENDDSFNNVFSYDPNPNPNVKPEEKILTNLIRPQFNSEEVRRLVQLAGEAKPEIGDAVTSTGNSGDGTSAASSKEVSFVPKSTSQPTRPTVMPVLEPRERQQIRDLEKAKSIAFNSREVRLMGPDQKEVEMKDDIATKVVIVLDNLRSEASDLWSQVSENVDKSWSQMSQNVDKGWVDLKKAVEKVITPQAKSN